MVLICETRGSGMVAICLMVSRTKLWSVVAHRNCWYVSLLWCRYRQRLDDLDEDDFHRTEKRLRLAEVQNELQCGILRAFLFFVIFTSFSSH